METLVHKDIKFKLTLSDDGSGKGAAMVACVAERSPLSKPLVNDEETIGYENMN
jgi:hypothetical protein